MSPDDAAEANRESRSLTEMSDAELLEEARRKRRRDIGNAFIIGFLLGILLFSVLVSGFGFGLLLPLLLLYLFINNDKPDGRELERVLKERNLK